MKFRVLNANTYGVTTSILLDASDQFVVVDCTTASINVIYPTASTYGITAGITIIMKRGDNTAFVCKGDLGQAWVEYGTTTSTFTLDSRNAVKTLTYDAGGRQPGSLVWCIS